MKDQQAFDVAFNRADVSNGPWFADDDLDAVVLDIRMFCGEDWQDMVQAAGGRDDAIAGIKAKLDSNSVL